MRVTPWLRAVCVWLLAAIVLGGALVVAGRQHSPLDDPDLAMQRPGFLDAVGPRSVGPPVTTSIPAAGRTTVVFFVRTAQQRLLMAALSRPGALPPRVDAVIVGGPVNVSAGPIAMLTDGDGSLARGYAMPVPRDGGPPVGYAIVSTAGVVRYRTLDPGVAWHLDEVRTMLRAL